MQDLYPPCENGDQRLHAAAVNAVRAASLSKNLPVTAEDCLRIAGLMLSYTDEPTQRDLAATDRDAARQLAARADVHLDIFAIVTLTNFIAGIEAKPLSDPAVVNGSSTIIAEFERSAGKGPGLRWPAPLELVAPYYAGKLRGPTVAVREDGTVVTRWWRGLAIHRDPKDGPASIEVKGSRRVEEYWVDGVRHRPHEDGPAETIADTVDGKARRVEAYWLEGRRHRPHTAGPALITRHYHDNLDLSGEEYFEDGKEHRPSTIGPAVTHWDSTGRKVLELYMEHGKLHRDPGEGPAGISIHDPVTVKDSPTNALFIRYCVNGENHRDAAEGPAVVQIDKVTGATLEEYWRNGVLHRDGAPAIIDRIHCCFGGVTEMWFRDGQLHRGDGPAQVCRDGEYRFEHWYVDGVLHRDPAEGAAFITHDADGVREEFWVNGERYPPEGPHSVTRDRDGRVVQQLIWDGEMMCPYPPHTSEADAAST
jgi:hypothetical protein